MNDEDAVEEGFDGEVEKYFEVDHEAQRHAQLEEKSGGEIKKEAEEKSKGEIVSEEKSKGEIASEEKSKEETASASPSIRELMAKREDTPSRKRLREMIQKTTGNNSMTNSIFPMTNPCFS